MVTAVSSIDAQCFNFCFPFNQNSETFSQGSQASVFLKTTSCFSHLHIWTLARQHMTIIFFCWSLAQTKLSPLSSIHVWHLLLVLASCTMLVCLPF
jgi:hypothetical protein